MISCNGIGMLLKDRDLT
ncbi:hypothetical protein F8388_014326, partial [Cannabis sativa]